MRPKNSPFSYRTLTRRDLLKFCLLTAAALFTGCADLTAENDGAEKEATQNDTQENERIIVLGAGMAGLAAARTLVSRGFDVTILEGRQRIGGRVWTDHAWADVPVDLGASWIHGIKGNPLTDLAKTFKVETLPTDYDSIPTYDTAGQLLTEAEQERVDNKLDALLAALDEERERRQAAGEPDISLGQAIQQILAEVELSDQQVRELNYSINTTIEQEYAADVAALSLFYWDEGEEFYGADVIFPEGYSQIIEGLAAGLDIQLNQGVTQIEYDDEGVRITTKQGAFEADRVVVTLPLGVLKSGQVEFSPALPAAKLQAISRLGMGLLDKVYLRFAEAFWAEAETELFGYIAADKDEWAGLFLNIYQYTEEPILLCFNAGTYGLALEALADETIVAKIMTVLRTIYGDDIPEPEDWLFTRWAADPFARGSYSYLPPGATPDDYDSLAEPVIERLFFAGEATERDYSATVHGAYLSGLREAERIADLV